MVTLGTNTRTRETFFVASITSAIANITYDLPVPVAKSRVADNLSDKSKSSCIKLKSLFHLALITGFFSKFSFANAVISLYSPELRKRKAVSAASF